MPPKVQMVLMGSAIACLAIGLAAFVAIRNDYFKQNAQISPDQGKSAFVSELSAELDGILPKKNTTTTASSDAVLTAAACAKAGGTWNECGSLCRGKPAGTVCAQVCVPQCECTVGEKQCPQGYSCASDLPAGDGVCKVGTSDGAIPSVPVMEMNEFKSADGVTSVVLPTLKLANPFSFHGTSTAFENAMSWKLEQADGKVVANGFMMVDSPDAGIPGAFQVRAYYEKIPTMASGTLIVYEASAKDGSPIHEVRIPVELTTRQVGAYVYWSNSKKTPGMPDCSVVFPVKHQVIALPGDELRVAMHELMKGPTKWELSQGYSTNLSAGTADPEPTLSGLEFGEDLQQGVGGSCRVSAIRAQINETYKKNTGEDKNPVISIDGRTEDILQP
jgi:hypothetical protein